MEGLIWESSFLVFFFLTCIIAGGIAWMTGRSIASTWRARWQVIAYVALLTAVTRFMHFALFEGTLLSAHYYIVDFIVLIVIGHLGYFTTRANQMAQQYSWMYKRSGPITARLKQNSDVE
ncbi:hypothetical protein F9L33_05075 [Amylibacter sp. SFDW26]|uniref:DUF6867 family protein n=1 Tax=Amylibacter sp. SFDW26 TaxID=2652722 RepID=UPI0012619607|nr:hypothetical protein [Amylibacter sp. SFDW26]KAB7616132.1 hypothetical protein F9L33_05075 [Amylibacter sp. SFDW26]